MAHYEIRFLKDVCNDTGHPRCVLQHVIALEAEDRRLAQDQACALSAPTKKSAIGATMPIVSTSSKSPPPHAPAAAPKLERGLCA